MKSFLKIKNVSLAAEASAIRREEVKWKKWAAKAKDAQSRVRRDNVRSQLYLHRVKDVRREARASHLAYGFLRGRPYSIMEQISYTSPNWERIEHIVKKFADLPWNEIGQKFAEWKDEALIYRNGKDTQNTQAT